MKDVTINIELAREIVKNNYAVISVFDDVAEGLSSKRYLTEKNAKTICSNKKRGYLTSYRVIERVAIIGIVPFNDELAYIFNKPYTIGEETDNITITSHVYDGLIDCYVYRNSRMSKRHLDLLVKEYKSRGGIVFPTYHSYEQLILKEDREERIKEYVNEIVFESIFKHGFREVGKRKWANGSVVIKQHSIQKGSMKYPNNIKHTEMEVCYEDRLLIGSIFGKYYNHINQLGISVFGIICKTDIGRSYEFAYFEIYLNNELKENRKIYTKTEKTTYCGGFCYR